MDNRRNKRFEQLGQIETYNFHASNQVVEIQTPLEITLRDVSVGGLGIKCNTALSPDTTLSMNLDFEDENYVVIGKVVWCRATGNVFSCGLKLIYMPDELVTYLSDLESGSHKYSN
ncbi:PilZ domain-containing protein [Fusibacter tunisiensis]|uniref:C-di-GMP-binding flagellar brake protein YcgR n=1 Tax=Fusibacter tunisiensis TaxID=1008308 RepID=A0ABS2MNV4_9FIRM|nr:PilZ domain-containing protein [Fusibacter tunisiensis]MBM7561075.1 c-di-GMP-binding flagellar brake protein YcgR [Fusibacter tunisiensis]